MRTHIIRAVGKVCWHLSTTLEESLSWAECFVPELDRALSWASVRLCNVAVDLGYDGRSWQHERDQGEKSPFGHDAMRNGGPASE